MATTNKNLFVKNGRPANFYFHFSLDNEEIIADLTNNILMHGGLVVEAWEEQITDVVLWNSDRPQYAALATAFKGLSNRRNRNIWVEPESFIQTCIGRNKFEPSGRTVLKKRMAGCPPGKKRTPFNAEDDENLCLFLAARMPEKEAGGRQGMGIYNELWGNFNVLPSEFRWVERHTPSSWRERYKKKQEILDPRIRAIVEEDGCIDPEVTFEYTRLPVGQLAMYAEEEEESEDNDDERMNQYNLAADDYMDPSPRSSPSSRRLPTPEVASKRPSSAQSDTSLADQDLATIVPAEEDIPEYEDFTDLLSESPRKRARTSPNQSESSKKRAVSESGSDRFPLSGTRARTTRKSLLEQQKQVEYTPPRGTKAATIKGH